MSSRPLCDTTPQLLPPLVMSRVQTISGRPSRTRPKSQESKDFRMGIVLLDRVERAPSFAPKVGTCAGSGHGHWMDRPPRENIRKVGNKIFQLCHMSAFGLVLWTNRQKFGIVGRSGYIYIYHYIVYLCVRDNLEHSCSILHRCTRRRKSNCREAAIWYGFEMRCLNITIYIRIFKK